MAVAGLRGTGDWSTDERPKNFRELILWTNPNGTAPIFALSSRAPKQSVDDPEFSWWCEPNAQIRLTVNGALSSSATTVVVTGVEPNASDLSLNWGSALSLKSGDLLLVEPASEAATFDHDIIMVTGVTSSSTFTVSCAAAGTSAAGFLDA